MWLNLFQDCSASGSHQTESEISSESEDNKGVKEDFEKEEENVKGSDGMLTAHANLEIPCLIIVAPISMEICKYWAK